MYPGGVCALVVLRNVVRFVPFAAQSVPDSDQQVMCICWSCLVLEAVNKGLETGAHPIHLLLIHLDSGLEKIARFSVH